MSFNFKIRSWQVICQLVSIFSIYYLFLTEQFAWLWITFVMYIIMSPISTGLTLHRLLTHRSFKTYPWLENVLSFITIYSTVGTTIAWVGLHRYHHAHSDESTDPHSPYDPTTGNFSIRQAVIAWTGFGWHVPHLPLKFVKDLIKNPIHKFIFENYFKVLCISIVVLFLINPILLLFAYFLPASLTLHSIGFVNVLGHVQGYRNHNTRDHSTNSWIANLITLGEGWHNNHHAKPNKYHLKEKWWEWDLIGDLIKVIKI